jgi:hypothetical protein
MTLAQVVYNISNDTDFASRWSSNPEAALAEKGLKLSKEEFAFLSKGLKRGEREHVSLQDLVKMSSNWRY